MSTTVTVHVLLFGRLREIVGADALEMELPTPATGEALLDSLASEYPDLAHFREHLRLAVNERYAPNFTALQDGDQVALIPPVSGG